MFIFFTFPFINRKYYLGIIAKIIDWLSNEQCAVSQHCSVVVYGRNAGWHYGTMSNSIMPVNSADSMVY